MLGFATKDALDSALAYYEQNSSFSEIDAGVYAAKDSTDPESDDPTTVMSGESNPLNRLTEESAKEEGAEDTSAAEAVKKDYTIALIDTGASVDGEHVLSAVSMIGNNPEDDNGHGTQMVSFITEEDPNAYIISIKALDSEGVGSISSIYAAMEYAIDHKANIINLSLSAVATAKNSLLGKEVEKAHDQGITVVGAAGNDNNDASYYVPGNIEQALIVGSANEDGTRRDGSNYGDTVDYNIVSDSTSEAAARMSGIISARKITKSTFAKIDFDYLIRKHVIYPANETSAVSFLPSFEMFDGFFKAQAVTVTYNTNGGTFNDGTTSKAVTDGSIPSNPTRSGYTFNGWFTAASGGSNINTSSAYTQSCVSPQYNPSSDQTVYAQWTKIKYYALTFNTNGGTSTDTLSYSLPEGGKYSSVVTTIPSATRNGYLFNGWASSSTATTPNYSNDTTMGTSDVVYYAVWIPKAATKGSCTVTIDNDGNLVIGTSGTSCTISVPSGTFSDYANVATTLKFQGSVTMDVKPSASTGLFGHYSKLKTADLTNCSIIDTYTNASFKGNEYSLLFIDDSSLQSVNFGTIKRTLPKGGGFSMFSGCTSLTSIKNISSLDTSQATTFANMFSGCASLSSVDVSGFDTSKATSMSGMFENCSNLENIDVLNFNTAAVTDMSRMFDGCAKLKSLDISNFNTVAAAANKRTVSLGGSATLINYGTDSVFYGCKSLSKITFGPNCQFITAPLYADLLYPTPSTTISGAESTGSWGKGAEVNGDPVKTVAELATYGETLGNLTGTWYAQAATYKVTFNGNGQSSGSTAEQTILRGVSTALTANGFTKNGYDFSKWNTAADGSGASYTGKQSVTNIASAGENINLYAIWDVHSYTITYTLNGGTISNQPTSYSIETASFTLPTPTRAGYIFAGWTGSNGTTAQTSVTIAQGSTGNKSYTANWAHYAFTGWNTKPDGSGTTYKPGDPLPDANLDLYAQWG